MTEIWFYHLMTRSVEQVLPSLLEKARERGWSIVVQGQDEERIEALNQLLWTYEPTSFLPHGSARDGDGADQPIWLSTQNDTPNGARIRFMIDGADVVGFMAQGHGAAYERIMVLFDGQDDAALAHARVQWKSLKESGAALSYYQQNDDGRWEKKA